jgi:hypothetical protein
MLELLQEPEGQILAIWLFCGFLVLLNAIALLFAIRVCALFDNIFRRLHALDAEVTPEFPPTSRRSS